MCDAEKVSYHTGDGEFGRPFVWDAEKHKIVFEFDQGEIVQ